MQRHKDRSGKIVGLFLDPFAITIEHCLIVATDSFGTKHVPVQDIMSELMPDSKIAPTIRLLIVVSDGPAPRVGRARKQGAGHSQKGPAFDQHYRFFGGVSGRVRERQFPHVHGAMIKSIGTVNMIQHLSDAVGFS